MATRHFPQTPSRENHDVVRSQELEKQISRLNCKRACCRVTVEGKGFILAFRPWKRCMHGLSITMAIDHFIDTVH